MIFYQNSLTRHPLLSFVSQLDIQYDHFVRTTEDKHAALVTEVLKRVWDKGDIYKADYEGYYCVDCEEFKDEKEMDEHRNCPTHRKPCQHRKEVGFSTQSSPL